MSAKKPGGGSRLTGPCPDRLSIARPAVTSLDLALLVSPPWYHVVQDLNCRFGKGNEKSRASEDSYVKGFQVFCVFHDIAF
jgi:hypothetical protein